MCQRSQSNQRLCNELWSGCLPRKEHTLHNVPGSMRSQLLQQETDTCVDTALLVFPCSQGISSSCARTIAGGCSWQHAHECFASARTGIKASDCLPSSRGIRSLLEDKEHESRNRNPAEYTHTPCCFPGEERGETHPCGSAAGTAARPRASPRCHKWLGKTFQGQMLPAVLTCPASLTPARQAGGWNNHGSSSHCFGLLWRLHRSELAPFSGPARLWDGSQPQDVPLHPSPHI